MSDAVKEQLSAFLDGELAAQELDLLLKRLGRDPELRDALGRYALCREALRGDRAAPASTGFAGNVMAAIEADVMAAIEADVMAAPENESAAGGSVRPHLRVSPAMVRRLRPVAGVAVAAGVAAVAILAVQPGSIDERQVHANAHSGSQTTSAPMITADTVAPNERVGAVTPFIATRPEQPSYTVPASTSSTPFVPAARLTNYVVAHSEFSSPLGRRSMLSGVLAEGDQDADESPPPPSDGPVETQVTTP